MASFQLTSLLTAYKERFDKDNFIKNLLLDNLLLVDIYNRSKKLHIDTDVRRIVLLIEVNNERDMNSLETVRSIYTGRPKDFITAVDEKNVIVVREVKDNETYDDLCKGRTFQRQESPLVQSCRRSRMYQDPTRKPEWHWM